MIITEDHNGNIIKTKSERNRIGKIKMTKKTDKEIMRSLRSKLRVKGIECEKFRVLAEERNSKYYDEMRSTNELKQKLSREEGDNKSFNKQLKQSEDIYNIKNNFIVSIFNIMMGEAEDISKYQVIRDLFLDDIKRVSEQNKIYDDLPYRRGSNNSMLKSYTDSMMGVYF